MMGTHSESRRFLLGFFVGSLAGLFAARLAARLVVEQQWRDSFAPAVVPQLRPGVASAPAAKRAGLFWLTDCNNNGAALDLRGNPELFDSVFPGYGTTRLDGDFWRRYFHLSFDSVIVSPLLTSRALAQTMVSWSGNLLLFKTYGADVIYLGSSETFHGLIPAELRIELARSGVKEATTFKVLSLGVGNMPVWAVGTAAKEAAASGRKARIAIWGYSAWNAYKRPDMRPVDGPINDALVGLRSSAVRNSSRLEFWEEFPKPDWFTLIPFNLQEYWDAKRGLLHPDFTFSSAALADDESLDGAISTIHGSESAYADIGPRNCDMTNAALQLDAAIADLSRVADRILIYVPPTTPLQAEGVPSCYLPAVRRMLAGRANTRVFVHTGGWEDYGLSYRDYVKPSNRIGSSWVDMNHVNFEGARKVTKRVAHWGAEALK